MKDELLYYYSIMTPYEIIKEGITSNDTAANMFETAFIVTAASNVYVGLFSTAISALTAYINYTGQTPITGSYSDFVQVKLKYNTYTKYTYVDIGGYMIGAVTRQIKLVSSDVFQYYFNYYGGSEVNTHKDYYSCYIKTPNYNNPAPIALQYVNVPWVETINAHICNHPIYF